MCVAVFLPECRRCDSAVLREAGCEALFDRMATPMFSDCIEGPGGKFGKLVYTDHGRMPLAAYNSDSQDWLDCGAYWLGTWKDYRPTPELLQRETLHDGHPIILADNNSWVIPIADYLPKRLTIDRETGEEASVTSREHRQFVARANELFAWFIGDEFQARVENEKTVHVPGGLSFAADALAKNYRVNLDLVDHLGLVDELKAFEIARIVTALPLVEAAIAQKKTGGLVESTS